MLINLALAIRMHKNEMQPFTCGAAFQTLKSWTAQDWGQVLMFGICLIFDDGNGNLAQCSTELTHLFYFLAECSIT